MTSRSKRTFVLLGLVIAMFALMAIACDDEEGNKITVKSLGEEAVTVGEEIVQSLDIGQIAPFEGGHGDGICKSTGLNCR